LHHLLDGDTHGALDGVARLSVTEQQQAMSAYVANTVTAQRLITGHR
jgi:hypothetical protein